MTSDRETNETSFLVPAMTCEHCVRAVDTELRAVPGIADVTIDLDSKAVVVTGREVAWDAIAAAVDEAGYEAVR
ncbi:MAG: heavy-metal-associated domain-containing protein [Acidimicrobiia bacterium]|nr:heavy-metal-associated domain-containing protein [Acidimicrobiia bacterium]